MLIKKDDSPVSDLDYNPVVQDRIDLGGHVILSTDRFTHTLISSLMILVYLTGAIGDFSFMIAKDQDDEVIMSCSDHECGCGPEPGLACCCFGGMTDDEDDEVEDPAEVSLVITACGVGKKPSPSSMRVILDPHLVTRDLIIAVVPEHKAFNPKAISMPTPPDWAPPEKVPIRSFFFA